MKPVMTFLALVALAAPVLAERLTVTISWVEQDVYHAEHPTSDIYLFTEGCQEVVRKEPVVLDMQAGPPEVVRLLFYGGRVECRVVKAMADGQVAEERTQAEEARPSLLVQAATTRGEPVELHPTGDFTHPTADFPMPERVGPFRRGAVTRYDEAARDVSAGYNAVPDGELSLPIAATLYVYPNDVGTELDAGFEALLRGVCAQHAGARVELRKNILLAEDRFIARYAVLAFEEPWGGLTESIPLRSYLVLYRWGGWWVKWRVTTPAPVDGPRMRAIVELTESLVPPVAGPPGGPKGGSTHGAQLACGSSRTQMLPSVRH